MQPGPSYNTSYDNFAILGYGLADYGNILLLCLFPFLFPFPNRVCHLCFLIRSFRYNPLRSLIPQDIVLFRHALIRCKDIRVIRAPDIEFLVVERQPLFMETFLVELYLHIRREYLEKIESPVVVRLEDVQFEIRQIPDSQINVAAELGIQADNPPHRAAN